MSRLSDFLTEPSPVHNGIRLCDLLPLMVIGAVLIIVWPNSHGWAALVWFLLAFGVASEPGGRDAR